MTDDLRPGPIPARAGEPVRETVASSGGRWAYPRPRGGATPHRQVPLDAPAGLSPPARGSRGWLDGNGPIPAPARARSLAVPSGPIPARAGEPSMIVDALSPPGAYPRPRGGAEEPSVDPRARLAIGAYPRPRGGAHASAVP